MRVIFGKYGKSKESDYIVTEKDFQNPHRSDKSVDLATCQMNKIHECRIDNVTLPELFVYDSISLWWFFYPQIVQEMLKTLDLVTNFLNFVEQKKPTAIKITDFSRFSIINQICRKKKIKVEYSSVEYFNFQVKKKINKFLKKYGYSFYLNKKIKNRKTIFYKKRKVIPDVKDKIIFPIIPVFRREIFNSKKGISEKGEFSVHKIIDLLDGEDPVGIDLFSQLRDDEKVLSERLDSDIPWFPLEILLKRNGNGKKEFLKKYEKITSSQKFQSFFKYDEISIWESFEEIFNKMSYSSKLPYWLDILDSLYSFFSANRPKAVFLLYETGEIAQAFIQTCRKIGIPTIGIQHAFIHKHHVYYSQDRIATKDDPYGFPFPDKFLLFGDSTRKVLIEKDYPAKSLEVFGNPNFFDLEKIEETLMKKSLFEKYQLDSKKPIVLLTTTGLQELRFDTGQHNYDSQTWKYLVKNFANKENYQIILKPHPAENTQLYENILKKNNCSNIKIIQGNLLELIYMSSMIVSIFSSTMLDALCFKKPVIKVNFGNAYSTPLDGYGVVINSELDDLQKNIQMIVTDDKIRNKLKKNCFQFIKDSYNIPEQKPESILKKVLE